MNPLLEHLQDIEGLDAISAWPLAIGWWVALGMGILMASALAYFIARKLAFMRSWRNDTFQRLALLEKNLSEATAREIAIELSEYLRRIALRRFPRNECAGLTGEAWLTWLAERDPKKFDWEKKGTLLIELPYAPANRPLSTSHIRDLIQAVRSWVR